jgi:membrane-associated protease RseP (regulator of RpoE activity)
MTELPNEIKTSGMEQSEFERITSLVSNEFEIEQSLLENSVPTYYLSKPKETKNAFLRLLKALAPMNLMAVLRKREGRIVLRVVGKPPQKRSNILINWALFFATIGTTFVTGYLLSEDMLDPLLGGATFTIAIMAVLGMHEMGHKLTANRRGIDATPPYFIPGPPPIGGFLGLGTFGAVIMQKSLPSNKDALFDVGASGPIIGFVIAVVTLFLGFPFSSYIWIKSGSATLPVPLIFRFVESRISPFGPIPVQPPGYDFLAIRLHPVAFAGWVGILVTMLNILPAAMLDGGHVARSLAGEKVRLVLTGVSIILLIVSGYLPMAVFVLFLAMYKHPGPLDDVSSLSAGRKLLTVGLIAIFILCLPDFLIYDLLRFFGL